MTASEQAVHNAANNQSDEQDDDGKRHLIIKTFESLMFSSRFLVAASLAPFLVIMLMCVVYLYKEVAIFLWEAGHLNMEFSTFVADVLDLLDLLMFVILVHQVNSGSYEVFVHRMRIPAKMRPRWLDHMDPGMLKVKMAYSVAGITAIGILKDSFDALHDVTRIVAIHVVLHLVLVFSALIFAKIWKVTQSKDHTPGHQPETGTAKHSDLPPASGGELPVHH